MQLTPDGKGWIDDFGVKGPAPKSAKLSWDKSPVANGAHYFLFGKVDDRDPVGVLRESGFGVEFPNYIVDVQKDAKTGELQFFLLFALYYILLMTNTAFGLVLVFAAFLVVGLFGVKISLQF